MPVAMTSRERMLAAMTGRMPDRVPNSPRIWAFLAGYYGECGPSATLRAATEFDFDPLITLGSSLRNYIEEVWWNDPVDLPDVRIKLDIEQVSDDLRRYRRTIRTPDGMLHDVTLVPQAGGRFGISPNPHKEEYLYKTPEDMPRLRHLLPPMTDQMEEDLRRQVCTYAPQAMTVIRPHVGIDSILLESVGLENALVMTIEQPEHLQRLMDMYDDYWTGLMQRCLGLGADGVFESWFNCSLSAGWPPTFLHQQVFPRVRQHQRMIREANQVHLYYDDGRISDVLEDLADSGVDAIHTLSPPPMGDVDLADAKRRVGHRLTLMGNLDLINVIMRGDPRIIRQAVWQAIDDAGEGGRYILSTSDSIRDGTPLANVRAYCQAGREFGDIYRF